MIEVQKYLAFVYIKAGVKLIVEEDKDIANTYNIITDFDDYEIDKIYTILMKLKDENYDFYLQCLSAMIFSTYFSIKANNDLLNLKDTTDDPIEEEVINTLGQMADEDQQYAPQLFEIFKNADNTKDADDIISDDVNSKRLMKVLIAEHVGNILECSYDSLCSDIMVTKEYLSVYQKYVDDNTILNTFLTGLDYIMEIEGFRLTESLNFVYSINGSIESVYELHNYILMKYNKKHDVAKIADYIYSILWDTYIHSKNLEETDYYTEQMKEFVNSFENNQNFKRLKCYELVTNPNASDVFQLFLKVSPIIPRKDIDEVDIEELHAYSSECHGEINEYIRKLIPSQNKETK